MIPLGHQEFPFDDVSRGMKNYILKLATSHRGNDEYGVTVNGQLITCTINNGKITCYTRNKCIVVKKMVKKNDKINNLDEINNILPFRILTSHNAFLSDEQPPSTVLMLPKPSHENESNNEFVKDKVLTKSPNQNVESPMSDRPVAAVKLAQIAFQHCSEDGITDVMSQHLLTESGPNNICIIFLILLVICGILFQCIRESICDDSQWIDDIIVVPLLQLPMRPFLLFQRTVDKYTN
jgi:hypothetical protein